MDRLTTVSRSCSRACDRESRLCRSARRTTTATRERQRWPLWLAPLASPCTGRMRTVASCWNPTENGSRCGPPADYSGAVSAEPLLPIYLLAGTDRPKHVRALARLRTRFGPESVEILAADASSGDDAVGACNALGLFAEEGGRLVVVHGVERWRKADIDAVGAYLTQPAPGAVLALVAEEPLKSAALTSLGEKHGQVLQFDVPRPANLHAWVRSEFERLGAKADA